MSIDWLISLPWPNRRRPFVAFHVTRWGDRHRVGLMAGRQFMPDPKYRGWAWWFDV